MTDTIITVRGQCSRWYPAERATVQVDLRVDGTKRDAVFSAATASAAMIRESISAIADPDAGPVTWWSSGTVTVWWERPWNNEGKQLAPVYHASIDFSVKFSDFAALGGWIETVAAVEGAVISRIDWDLTEAKRQSVTAEVRTLSVADAIEKATVYATSIGLNTVTATALADPGMLGEQQEGTASEGSARFLKANSMMASGGAGEVQLRPEEIEVTSTVDARFVARFVAG